jgi:mRNA capping enzyme, catalytic domain/mRNA capping enzyme, beta chain
MEGITTCGIPFPLFRSATFSIITSETAGFCCCPDRLAATLEQTFSKSYSQLFLSAITRQFLNMSKRPAFDLKNVQAKMAKLDAAVASQQQHASATLSSMNPFLTQPVHPEMTLQSFLMQVRNAARRFQSETSSDPQQPVTTPFCEVEARLGVLKVNHAVPERRVTSSGAKSVGGKSAKAFSCTDKPCSMVSGVCRTHYIRTTGSGISEVSPLSYALNVSSADALKRDLVETERVETVYTGYSNHGRVCFEGEHPNATHPVAGIMESKKKLMTVDLTIPASSYDLRVSLSSEKVMDNALIEPPPGWKSKRIKRRRSYKRSDQRIAWQVDVTEVSTSDAHDVNVTTVDYEIEVELIPSVLLKLINEDDEAKLKTMTTELGHQLWKIIAQINPLKDAVDVEECLRDHPNHQAVDIALAQCAAFLQFMDSGGTKYDSPIGKSISSSAELRRCNFVGCMPVNFSRHNIEEIQRSPDNAYFLSEKTDGVRHLMIFTGDTVVLVDRAMRGKQPISADSTEPFAPIMDLIRPGTVLDGEVVMNRRVGQKPRPIFIVFDVLSISTTEPVLHLPFSKRLQHLRQATFRTATAARDMFDARHVADTSISLPLVRKNFVRRTDIDSLLGHVVEEGGMRCYRSGELHNHLTDGIIFQPDLPYVCGTDVNLLKWKYLDTVTVDVEILPLRRDDDDSVFRVGCLGEENTRVDMTRYVLLPQSERLRLEADRFETGGIIAEVGFDPETGEWYYLTMRSDKRMPNHISTVLGTLLELAESLTTDELRFRMGVPAGTRDTYRRDMRNMLRQLLDHQRRRLQSQRPATNGAR